MRRASAVSNSNIFGPNAWLIDEQFQQYSKDPNSVDKEWRDYFEANGAPKTNQPSPAAVKASEGAPVSAKQAVRETAVTAAAEKSAQPAPAKKAAKKTQQSPLDRISEAPAPGATQLKGMFLSLIHI